MNDPPILPPSHLAASRRQLRSSSQSPSRQSITDDLISHLSPSRVVEALRNPSGSLKICLEAASPAERSFAMRTAVASKKIHEWLQELLLWPWPAGSSSMGFEIPPRKNEKQSRGDGRGPGTFDNAAESGGLFIGSVLAEELSRYEARMEDIYTDMEDMDIEGIKAHVLHNHIMPLSRPGTPMSDSNRSFTSTMSSYSKMDDLTALLTATIVQALPILSKLTRLMKVWSSRLLVLRSSTIFLISLAEAEVALQSGWRTVNLSMDHSIDTDKSPSRNISTLSKGDFDVMRLFLESKVSKSARELDSMLDALEGAEDTLPDDWIDRLDSVEAGYGEWVVACERIIREAELRRKDRENETARLASPSSHSGAKAIEDDIDTRAIDSRQQLIESETVTGDRAGHHPAQESIDQEPSNHAAAIPAIVGHSGSSLETAISSDPAAVTVASPSLSATGRRQDIEASQPPEVLIKVDPVDEASIGAPQVPSELDGQEDDNPREQLVTSGTLTPEPGNLESQSSWQNDSAAPVDKSLTPSPKTPPLLFEPTGVEDGGEGFENEDSTTPRRADGVINPSSAVIPSLDGVTSDGIRHDVEPLPDTDHHQAIWRTPGSRHDTKDNSLEEDSVVPDDQDDLFDYSLVSPEEAQAAEPDLPPLLPHTKTYDDDSTLSPVPRLAPYRLEDLSSDVDYGTPDRPAVQYAPETEPAPADAVAASPASSPPTRRLSMRSGSFGYGDMPTLVEVLDDETAPRTPLRLSQQEDTDSPRTVDSPGRMSEISPDDQLQQQISEILESIPAKIRLTTEPSAINLNPPDLALPRIRTRPDPGPRSHSSLSSRAGTPSFTLAPAFARNARSRGQRGNQEIKLYHLSRSNGEPPIKLFIRLVGENGERVMVRVGGGWADLGEYLKEYATHHSRRSGGDSKVEIKDVLRAPSLKDAASSPPSRPASALDSYSPITPLAVRKTRKAAGVDDDVAVGAGKPLPKTPLAATVAAAGGTLQSSAAAADTPSSEMSTRSRSSSRLSWTEEDSSLGMAGPRARNVEMSEESKAWVESVKEKVRIASGERKPSDPLLATGDRSKFGEMGKVGATKRLFRKKG